MPSNYSIGIAGNKFDFELPSGNTCLMHELSIDDLLSMGILDQMDELGTIVQTDIAKASGRPLPESLQALADIDSDTHDGRQMVLRIMQDKSKWEKIKGFMDLVAVNAIDEPTLLPEPAKREDREPDKLYVNQVDLMDRLAVMGRALRRVMAMQQAAKPFRTGPAAPVATVADGEDVQLPTVNAGSSDGGASSAVS